MYCIKCGSKLPDNAKFCPNCATPVTEAVKKEDKEEPAEADKTVIEKYLCYFEDCIGAEERRLFYNQQSLIGKEKLQELNARYSSVSDSAFRRKSLIDTKGKKKEGFPIWSVGVAALAVVVFPFVVSLICTLFYTIFIDHNGMTNRADSVISWINIICIIIAVAVGIVFVISTSKDSQKRNAELAEIEAENRKIETDNQKNELEFEQAKKQEIAELSSEINALNSNLAYMNDKMNEEQNLLNSLFALNYLHRDYQTINACIAFHSYLESGKCSKLKGPHGCYEIYGYESRMDTMINKLDSLTGVVNNIAGYCRSILASTQAMTADIRRIHGDVINQNNIINSIQTEMNNNQQLLLCKIDTQNETFKEYARLEDIHSRQMLELAEYQDFAVRQKRLQDGYWY